MSDKNFKAFLEGIDPKGNENLIKTIIKGYEHLVEAGAGFDKEAEIDSENASIEPDNVSGDKSEISEDNQKINPNQALIDGLNGDLAREYAAAIQYIQHAAMMTGAQYMKITEEMLVHADEEIEHAKQISDRINYLGGVPTVEVVPMKTSSDSAEMIVQDKEFEEEAIRRYKERIKQAKELGDVGTKKILMEILSDEEEHRNDLMVALGQ